MIDLQIKYSNNGDLVHGRVFYAHGKFEADRIIEALELKSAAMPEVYRKAGFTGYYSEPGTKRVALVGEAKGHVELARGVRELERSVMIDKDLLEKELAASDIVASDLPVARGQGADTPSAGEPAPKAPAGAAELVFIRAKFAGPCHACGHQIQVGERMYYRTTDKKAFCPRCVAQLASPRAGRAS